MEAKEFQNLPNQSFQGFRIIKTNNPLILEVKQRYYHVGYLVYLMKNENPTIYFARKETELYHELNAFGIIKAVLYEERLEIMKILFHFNGVNYETTRKIFIGICTEREFEFGTKCFLPLKHFKCGDQLNQLELFEG